MAEAFEVLGGEQFAVVGKRLTEAGPQLRVDLDRNVQVALQPLRESIRASLQNGAPRRGGLAEKLAGSTAVKIQMRSGATAGARVVVSTDTDALDDGEIHHPTYGHAPLVKQSIKAQLISKPIEQQESAVEAGVGQAMESTARRVTR